VNPAIDEQQRSEPVEVHQGEEPDQDVDADLGQQSGEHRGDRGRSGRIAVRQPREQREDRRLGAEHDEEPQPDADLGRFGQFGNPLGEQGHVDRAGRRVDDGDAEEEQRRGEQVDDDVGHPGPDLRFAALVGEQHVAGDEDQLERHEQREEVTGEDRQAHAACEDEEDRADHRRIGTGRCASLTDGEQFDHEDRGGRDEEDQRCEQVGHQHDAEVGRPVTDPQHDRAVAVDLDEQSGGQGGHRSHRRHGDRVAHRAIRRTPSTSADASSGRPRTEPTTALTIRPPGCRGAISSSRVSSSRASRASSRRCDASVLDVVLDEIVAGDHLLPARQCQDEQRQAERDDDRGECQRLGQRDWPGRVPARRRRSAVNRRDRQRPAAPAPRRDRAGRSPARSGSTSAT
jgi:hypothetical protein